MSYKDSALLLHLLYLYVVCKYHSMLKSVYFSYSAFSSSQSATRKCCLECYRHKSVVVGTVKAMENESEVTGYKVSGIICNPFFLFPTSGSTLQRKLDLDSFFFFTNVDGVVFINPLTYRYQAICEKREYFPKCLIS